VVVPELAAEVGPRDPEREAPGADRAGRAHALPEGVVVARFHVEVGGRRAAAALRDDVDDAADGVRAVYGRLRPPHDLDAVDVVDGQVAEVELPRRRGLDPDAVDQDLDLGRVGAADADGGDPAGAPRPLDLHSRHRPESLLHRPVLLRAQELLGDHGHRGADLLERLLAPGGRHDDRVGTADLGRLRRRGRRGDLLGAGRRGHPECQHSGEHPSKVAWMASHHRTPRPRKSGASHRADRSPDSWLAAPVAPSREPPPAPSGVGRA
jgi:hypothetical protein